MDARPIEFAYDPATRIRVATYRGVVADGPMLDAYREMAVQPGFDPLAHDLADLRAVERFDVTSAGLAALGRLLSGGGGPWPAPLPGLAIVASSQEGYGIGRMYEQMTEPRLPKQTQVFADFEQAMAWLRGLPSAG